MTGVMTRTMTRSPNVFMFIEVNEANEPTEVRQQSNKEHKRVLEGIELCILEGFRSIMNRCIAKRS